MTAGGCGAQHVQGVGGEIDEVRVGDGPLAADVDRRTGEAGSVDDREHGIDHIVNVRRMEQHRGGPMQPPRAALHLAKKVAVARRPGHAPGGTQHDPRHGRFEDLDDGALAVKLEWFVRGKRVRRVNLAVGRGLVAVSVDAAAAAVQEALDARGPRGGRECPRAKDVDVVNPVSGERRRKVNHAVDAVDRAFEAGWIEETCLDELDAVSASV